MFTTVLAALIPFLTNHGQWINVDEIDSIREIESGSGYQMVIGCGDNFYQHDVRTHQEGNDFCWMMIHFRRFHHPEIFPSTGWQLSLDEFRKLRYGDGSTTPGGK